MKFARLRITCLLLPNLKSYRHYSVVVALLSLVLFYSSPLKSLHACNNLIHHHDLPAYETGHDDCSICDHSLSGFDVCSSSIAPAQPLCYASVVSILQTTVLSNDAFTDFNKGPPTAA